MFGVLEAQDADTVLSSKDISGLASMSTILSTIAILAGLVKHRRAKAGDIKEFYNLPLPLKIVPPKSPSKQKAGLQRRLPRLKIKTSCCGSSLHKAGACHGFDVHHHMKSQKKGVWAFHTNVTFEDKSIAQKQVLQPLAISTLAATFLMVVELVCGFRLRSLALLSDGVHQISDVAFYLGLLVAVKLSDGDADLRSFSYGFGRAQVLGAFVALLLQYFFTGLLVVSAASSMLSGESAKLEGTGAEVFVVGVLTLSLNMMLLWAFPANELGHNHCHGSAWGVARLHLLGDLIQGCAVIVSGLLRWADPRFGWADAGATLVYAAVVIAMSWNVFKGLLFNLLERTPESVDANEIYEDLSNLTAVIDVHCFHVWAIAPEKIAMSAHLHIEGDMHEDVLHAAQILLKHKYAIAHSTLQISSDEDIA